MPTLTVILLCELCHEEPATHTLHVVDQPDLAVCLTCGKKALKEEEEGA